MIAQRLIKNNVQMICKIIAAKVKINIMYSFKMFSVDIMNSDKVLVCVKR